MAKYFSFQPVSNDPIGNWIIPIPYRGCFILETNISLYIIDTCSFQWAFGNCWKLRVLRSVSNRLSPYKECLESNPTSGESGTFTVPLDTELSV